MHSRSSIGILLASAYDPLREFVPIFAGRKNQPAAANAAGRLARVLLNRHYFIKSRYRNVTTCARVQVSSGANVVALVPLVMSLSTAQRTALPK